MSVVCRGKRMASQLMSAPVTPLTTPRELELDMALQPASPTELSPAVGSGGLRSLGGLGRQQSEVAGGRRPNSAKTKRPPIISGLGSMPENYTSSDAGGRTPSGGLTAGTRAASGLQRFKSGPPPPPIYHTFMQATSAERAAWAVTIAILVTDSLRTVTAPHSLGGNRKGARRCNRW
jgi:hypothetical protein